MELGAINMPDNWPHIWPYLRDEMQNAPPPTSCCQLVASNRFAGTVNIFSYQRDFALHLA